MSLCIAIRSRLESCALCHECHPLDGKEKPVDLMLELVKDLLEKNRALAKFEVNEEKQKALFFLRFPVERRKMVYYKSTNP